MEQIITKDWKEYERLARQASAEGCILLENQNEVLPLKRGTKVSVFGRIQEHYYKSGTGSGGMVNVDEVVSIPEGLRRSGYVTVNEELVKIYREWETDHPINLGKGWGWEPWSQEEMPLSEETAAAAAIASDIAVVIIGRTAGEDSDQSEVPGSYLLTDIEQDMLHKVRRAFQKMVVLLNIGGLLDMSFIDEVKPDAVMIVWQGGMLGGYGVADALCGICPPSGHLPDTVAYQVADYPSATSFGDPARNVYKEDIFVGYRYFETVAKERVRYPFGYGLTYTAFKEEMVSVTGTAPDTVELTMRVINCGEYAGRHVVFSFIKAPEGALAKPDRVLAGFAKTKELKPGESQEVTIKMLPRDYASFDDDNGTGHLGAFVLEAGVYEIYAGSDVRRATKVHSFEMEETVVLDEVCADALAPVIDYDRMSIHQGKLLTEHRKGIAPQDETRRKKNIPLRPAKVMTDRLLTLDQVAAGEISLERLVDTLDEEELSAIVRGEGMGSAKVTPGTASAFAGISEKLKARRLPAICCDDGPSGMRLDSGVHAFSLPNGTMLASTFDTELTESIFEYTSFEMVINQVDILLGPGMNIHRHPLNGRNFEYFSEDPYLTAVMAEAVLRGLSRYGVCGCMKHFCGNNQEYKRHFVDAVISAKALREIYLRPYERVIRNGVPCAVMTTYGQVNGLWTAGSYDLNTQILREEWGFTGIVMTDWWANINVRGCEPDRSDFASMVRAQNDLYMCCRDAAIASAGDNLEKSLKDGSLSYGEIRRSAENICRFALTTQAYARQCGKLPTMSWLNKPKAIDDVDVSTLKLAEMVPGEDLVLDLTDLPSVQGTNYLFRTDLGQAGTYEVTVTGCSALSRVAQIPCTLFSNGIPMVTFSFRGTSMEDVDITQKVICRSPSRLFRLYVARNGVELKTMRIHYAGPVD